MSKKEEGYILKHIKSPCCQVNVRFEQKSQYGVPYAWCEKCGKYLNTRPIDSLLCLKLGDINAIELWDGYLPEWLQKLTEKPKQNNFFTCIECGCNEYYKTVRCGNIDSKNPNNIKIYCSECNKEYKI